MNKLKIGIIIIVLLYIGTGTIYHETANYCEEQQLIIISNEYLTEFVMKIHEELCHLGGKKIFSYVKDHYFWPNMLDSIKKCLYQCIICSKRKIDQGRTKEILLPRHSSDFLEQIVIDIAYMDKTSSQKQYLLVIIDRFSKLVSLNAITKMDEQTIFKVILNNWIYKFGKPVSILTDRGKNFESNFLKSKLAQLNIKQEFSSPYQHQSNGLVERVIRTVRDMIVTSLKGKCEERNWYELLPRIEFSINATEQSATKYSPFEIVFGRKINLHSRFTNLTERKSDIKNNVRLNLESAAKNMTAYEINKRGSRIFKEGELVLVRVEPQNRKKI